MKELTRTVLAKVARIPDGDAYWTSDIAYDCRLQTDKTRRELTELARLGYVEIVVPGGRGLPTSWRITPAAAPLPRRESKMATEEDILSLTRAELVARILASEAERDEARLLVTEANNSLYGSQGYFHSLNGGGFDKYHLATGIEDLKASSREQWRRITAAEARVAQLEGEVTDAEIDDAVRCIALGFAAAVADKTNIGAALRRFVAARTALSQSPDRESGT